jgi:predicted nuclease with TOPRIM domain
MKMNNTFDHETAARLINGNPVKRDDIKRFVSEASQTFNELQKMMGLVEELKTERDRLAKEVELWKAMVMKDISG